MNPTAYTRLRLPDHHCFTFRFGNFRSGGERAGKRKVDVIPCEGPGYEVKRRKLRSFGSGAEFPANRSDDSEKDKESDHAESDSYQEREESDQEWHSSQEDSESDSESDSSQEHEESDEERHCSEEDNESDSESHSSDEDSESEDEADLPNKGFNSDSEAMKKTTERSTKDFGAKANEIIKKLTPYTEYVQIPYWAGTEISNDENMAYFKNRYPRLKLDMDDTLATLRMRIYGSDRNGNQTCRQELESCIKQLKYTDYVHIPYRTGPQILSHENMAYFKNKYPRLELRMDDTLATLRMRISGSDRDGNQTCRQELESCIKQLKMMEIAIHPVFYEYLNTNFDKVDSVAFKEAVFIGISLTTKDRPWPYIVIAGLLKNIQRAAAELIEMADELISVQRVHFESRFQDRLGSIKREIGKMFNQVYIGMPARKANSDVVFVGGSSEADVAEASEYLHNLHDELKQC